ncbi:MAG: helix-turn-helix domain-containing protein [Acidimicrobiia bacterium]
MSVRFRNVDVTSEDPDHWPFEAVLASIERGSVSDWRRLAAAIRANPWGSCARAVETVVSWNENYGVDRLLEGVVEHARSEADAESRREYGRRIRSVRISLGMTMREFAPLIGTSAARLSSYESGKVAPTANILGRVDRLTRGNGPPSDS